MGRPDPGEADGTTESYGGVALDLYSYHGRYRVEHPSVATFPEAVPSGPDGGDSLQEFSAG